MVSSEEQLLLNAYKESLSLKICKLREKYSENDSEGLIQLIHKLKGSAGMYGFADISRHADALQEVLSSSKSLESEQFKTTFFKLLSLMQSVD